MVKKNFIILAKKNCPYCRDIEKFFNDNKKKYKATFLYANVDFQDKEFKDEYGKTATYPRVFEKKLNGEKIFIGGCTDTIQKLENSK